MKTSNATRFPIENQSGTTIPCSSKQNSTLDFQAHSCTEMISIPDSGSGLVDVSGSQKFLGGSNIVVMDLGNLSGRLIATVWPDTSFVSKPGAEVVFS